MGKGNKEMNSPGPQIVADVDNDGGGSRGDRKYRFWLDWKIYAAIVMYLFVVKGCTNLSSEQLLSKPIAQAGYPAVSNVFKYAAEYTNFTFDNTFGKVPGLIDSFTGNNSLSSLASGFTKAIPSAPPQPEQNPAQANEALANVAPDRQCADWIRCRYDFNQVHGHFEWIVTEDGNHFRKQTCFWKPAAGDRWNVTGYVFGLDDTAWGNYYSSNRINHPPNEIYTGDPLEAIIQYDQACQNHNIQKPAEPEQPTVVPTPAPQVQSDTPGNGLRQIQDISLKFGGAVEGATGIIVTTKIPHLCLYMNQAGDTVKEIVRRLQLTDINAYSYYAGNSAHYASMNDNLQGFYFQSPAAIECH